jgi:acyl-CoA reductase-like NAD-dependent aldehyde dehydrogenase
MEVSVPEPHPLLLNGQAVPGEAGEQAVVNPYSGETIGVVSLASTKQAERAVKGAISAFRQYKSVPIWQRSLWLAKASDLIAQRSEELARIIAQEVAKPLRTARAEVSRAATTFRIASEEVYDIGGDVIPMDAAPGSEGRIGYSFRQPIGPILAITPFNFPLNLVAHKVVPALAAGNPFILRPTSAAPFTAFMLGEILRDAGFPPEVVSILPSSVEVAEHLVAHPDIPW